MAVLPIRHFPDDAALRNKAKKVSRIDGSVQQLIDDMIETMQQANGIGLAATQVGVPLRIIVLQMSEEELITIINPEIVKRAGEQEVTEGCLSVPGYYGEIKRSETVTVKGKDRHGTQVRIKGVDLMAEAIEHEIDHLNGILYIDHLESQDNLHTIEHAIESSEQE